MIKLKDLILEGRTIISKMEEQYALRVIIYKLLPHVVYFYNTVVTPKWGTSATTVEEAKRKLKKIKVVNYANGQEILYSISLPETTLEFNTRKLSYKKNDGDKEDRDVFQVGFYNMMADCGWGDYRWTMYDVEGLSQGKYDPDLISQIF